MSVLYTIVLMTYFFIVGCWGKTAERTNIMFVSDIEPKNINIYAKLIEEALQQISLADYRVSLHTTSGTSHTIYEFQTRKCLTEKLKYRKSQRTQSLSAVLKKSIKDLGNFLHDENIIIIIVAEKQFLNVEFKKITWLLKAKFNVYLINLISYNGIEDAIKTKQNGNVLEIQGRSIPKILEKLPFLKANLKKCQNQVDPLSIKSNTFVFDECRRQCECVNGIMINCKRIRKEFSSMDLYERKQYIRALKELSTNPRFKDIFSNYCNLHEVYFNRGLHQKEQFLPWHRKYLLGFENLLRLIDCTITVPVWNWAYFSKVAWNRAADYHMWDADGGFGGNGNPSKGFCVDDGEFQVHKWHPQGHASDIAIRTCQINDTFDDSCFNATEIPAFKTCLRRRFHGELPDYKMVLKIIETVKDLDPFELVVRTYWHGLLHNQIGGYMQTTYASFAPEFWCHHGMLDAIWYSWQRKEKLRTSQSFPGNNDTLIAFKPLEFRHNYIDSDNLGGCGIQVAYEQSSVFPNELRASPLD